MGINTSFANMLVQAKSNGADFTDLVTIGRQSLTVPPHELERLASRIDLAGPGRTATDTFAEGFFKVFLGSCTIRSIDYSDYQEADIIYDLNAPIPDEFEGQFDAVIDGGSLEHIFNIKQALGNYMKLVRTGGSVFILTTANNLCGHGFYQFSPEFFYRVFSPENGFETKNVVLIESPLLSVERSRDIRYFHVKDPSSVGKRIQLVNDRPTMIFVHGQRVSSKPPFSRPPLQSDYSGIKWQQKTISAAPAEHAGDAGGEEFSYVSRREQAWKRLRQWRKNSFRNKRFFRQIRF